MYKKGAGNDKQGKDAGNRTLCQYRNFSQAIMNYLTLLFDLGDLIHSQPGGGGGGRIRPPYQSLYGLKTYNLSEATSFHIRAFHLPTSCHMLQFKGMKRQKLAINWPQTGN